MTRDKGVVTSAPIRGIMLYLLAMLLITAMSAVVRILAGTVPIGQIVFWRSFAALLPILAYMALCRDLPRALFSNRPGLHAIRSGLGVLAMALSFLSLRFLPVANAQALAFLAPVFALPLAALAGGERLTWWVIAATALGLSGVFLMIGDSIMTPGQGAMIGVCAGLGFALVQAIVRVHVRSMTRTERPATIALFFAVTGSFAGLATLPLGWVQTDAATMALLLLAGLLGGTGHVVATEGIARAQVSTLAPLEYTGLLWALVFDLVLFNHLPTWIAVAGAGAIILAALMVTIRASA